MVGGEHLYTYTLEKPRRVGGNEGWLVGPVIEVVVAEQTDIRHEDSGVNVHSMHPVNVVAAVRFRKIAIRIGQVPLALRIAAIVPDRRRGILAELGHEAGAYVIPVKVAADAELLQLDFVGPEELARPAFGIVTRLIEVVVPGKIGPDFRGEEFGIKRDIMVAWIAVQPGPVVIRKRGLRVHRAERRWGPMRAASLAPCAVAEATLCQVRLGKRCGKDGDLAGILCERG